MGQKKLPSGPRIPAPAQLNTATQLSALSQNLANLEAGAREGNPEEISTLRRLMDKYGLLTGQQQVDLPLRDQVSAAQERLASRTEDAQTAEAVQADRARQAEQRRIQEKAVQMQRIAQAEAARRAEKRQIVNTQARVGPIPPMAAPPPPAIAAPSPYVQPSAALPLSTDPGGSLILQNLGRFYR